ncbi:uracil-DNA glycosylase family protein [Lentibacillus cibarius]|uniref:Uracil-DNA glycosylase-like domain-containing protein n=1 Tax=Lentibacillus cibarius TaxID=2583219 RepID=A0A5S3QKE7_9BACI|nr:uracil-DNA glycosylase family protein [Lentibacillus cibarius]TMN22219.1 hypothetical protein FFL34_08810 [Lentibacillus cibarius]
MLHATIERFLPFIRTLDTDQPLTKQDLLTTSLLMECDGDLCMYYAPHNDYINKDASIVIVGITPGWQQMKIAFEQFVKSLSSGDSLETCLKETKHAARFAGAMRKNLQYMLDECGIPNALGIPASANLFGNSRHLLHTTSIIKYPVFINGKNYTGHQPPIRSSAILQHYAWVTFPDELASIQPPTLVIPLGKTAEQIITRLAEEKKLHGHTYLTGLPHPSGANGHRVKQFQQQKRQLQEKIKAWADGRM